MTYPRGLDEISTAELLAELARRDAARAAGRCDYCGRPTTTTSCRFPERHRPREAKR